MITTFLIDFFGVLKYANDTETEWNEELLDFLKKSKKELYVFTSSSVHQSAEVRQKLDPIFANIFSVFELGMSKKDSKVYALIAEKIGKKPEEILFIDDTSLNVETAKKAGLNAVVYKSFEELKNFSRIF